MKRNYFLLITKETTNHKIPNYTTDKMGFKKWFESDIYRDEIFISTYKSNEKINPTHDEILHKEYFKNVDYREAMVQAQLYLKDNAALKNNFTSEIGVILLSIEKGKEICHKMKWIEPNFSNGDNRFLKGWLYYKNGELIKASKKPKKKTTHLVPISFGAFFALSLFFSFFSNNSELQIIFSALNFIAGITSSMVASLVRANFNFMAKNPKQLLFYNFEIEFPLWLSIIFTIITFANEELFINSLEQWGVIGISIIAILAVKFVLDYEMDLQNFYKRILEDSSLTDEN